MESQIESHIVYNCITDKECYRGTYEECEEYIESCINSTCYEIIPIIN